MISTIPTIVISSISILAYGGLIVWILRLRPIEPKARVKRRLLVREGDELIWRTVRARYLVGWPKRDGAFSVGLWDPEGGEWAVLETRRSQLIAYRVSNEKAEDQKVGTIQVCQSWRELEAVVPPKVFEEALVAAGFKKPAPRYREVPLQSEPEGREQP